MRERLRARVKQRETREAVSWGKEKLLQKVLTEKGRKFGVENGYKIIKSETKLVVLVVFESCNLGFIFGGTRSSSCRQSFWISTL